VLGKKWKILRKLQRIAKKDQEKQKNINRSKNSLLSEAV
jgi:hypothetical protein